VHAAVCDEPWLVQLRHCCTFVSLWCAWCRRYGLSPSDGRCLSVEALLEGAALLERDLVYLSASNATEGALPYMVRDHNWR
jgi:hypothetical protein